MEPLEQPLRPAAGTSRTPRRQRALLHLPATERIHPKWSEFGALLRTPSHFSAHSVRLLAEY
eukprot:SAG31_NODE_34309_length_334_cov_0.880851_1_plen_61_part_01